MRKSLLERFEEKYIPEPNSGCWLWFAAVAGLDDRGYFGMGSLGNMYAHRASWILNKGPIPDGLQVLHTCDMPECVNPDHLWLGTQGDNMRDCARKGRVVSPIANLRGEANPRAKIKAVDAAEIKTLPTSQAMEKFGISKGHVSRIKNGKSWA